MYDEFSLKLLKKRNAPDPEGNILRANQILALCNERRCDEAEALLPGITDPIIKEDLARCIEFDRTCRCLTE
jgi:hypothetical protein